MKYKNVKLIIPLVSLFILLFLVKPLLAEHLLSGVVSQVITPVSAAAQPAHDNSETNSKSSQPSATSSNSTTSNSGTQDGAATDVKPSASTDSKDKSTESAKTPRNAQDFSNSKKQPRVSASIYTELAAENESKKNNDTRSSQPLRQEDTQKTDKPVVAVKAAPIKQTSAGLLSRVPGVDKIIPSANHYTPGGLTPTTTKALDVTSLAMTLVGATLLFLKPKTLALATGYFQKFIG